MSHLRILRLPLLIGLLFGIVACAETGPVPPLRNSPLPLPTWTPAPPEAAPPTAYPTPTSALFPGDFRLTLTAKPLIGKAPLSVSFSARLTGGRDNSYELYCAGASWAMGNGVDIQVSPDCVQWTPAASLSRLYTTDYTYEQPGVYLARLHLEGNEQGLSSNSVLILVY
ncbi:MAG: hypothetical protein U0350_34880 [Caldilineaceae bacterium]